MSKTNGPHPDHRSIGTPATDPPAPGLARDLVGHVKVSIIATVLLAVIVCGFYPVVVWGLSQLMFHNKANGSLIGKDGKPASSDQDAVGSALLGQSFSDAKYFHPRPSGAGNGYDPTASGGSNLGPTSAKLMFGTTKSAAVTVIAHDKARAAAPDAADRVEGTVTAVTANTITLSFAGAPGNATTKSYPLGAAVADPATAVNFHGRTVKATTVAVGSKIELKLSDKTPPEVTAINVFDSEISGVPSGIDTTANTITFPGDAGASPTVINVPTTTTFIVNGKADAKLADVTTDSTARVLVAMVMDYDGVADRIVHYCEDNAIPYQSSIAPSSFKDADGIDDAKLITAFNGSATPPTLTPQTPIPADVVTASGSGLDPHVSLANARLQAQRVADARKVPLEKVNAMIEQYTDSASLGFLGEPGVNVLRLNLALDQEAPAPAAPATAPATTTATTTPTTTP